MRKNFTSFHWLDRSQQLVEEIQELWKQDFAEKEDGSRTRNTEALRILLKKTLKTKEVY